MRELIKEIWSTSKRNKLRTSLTGFAVAWGIFMLIFLLGAGNGLINAQLQQSTRFLANSMRVFPGETSKAYKGLKEGRSITLNDRDILISNQTYGQYVDDVGGRLELDKIGINDPVQGLYGNSTWLAFKQIMRGIEAIPYLK